MSTENVIYTYGATHELKTWPSFFNAVMNDIKQFEVRKFDRPFKIGDVLLLREYNPKTESYTGAVCTRQISYILNGGQFGIEEGFCVMGMTKY